MSLKKEKDCVCIKSLVERGWVQYRAPERDPRGKKLFIAKTNVLRKDKPGTIGMILNNCFICGHRIRANI